MAASLFGTQTQINLNTEGTVLTQSFTANQSQQVFTLTLFTYTPQTNSLQVHVNGQRQVSGRDFIETSSTTFTMIEGCTAGDYIDVVGYPQMELTSSGSGSSGITNDITTYGAIGDGVTDNTTVFNAIEGLTSTNFYMPEGTYKTTHLQLTKTYWGPGKLKFNDGYIQKGVDFTEYPPRNLTGHRTLTAAGDLILNPNGNVTLAGKRLQNLGGPLGDLDAVTLKYVNDYILSRIESLESAITGGTGIDYQTGSFTPTIIGGSTAGVGTYTVQRGTWVKVGKLLTVRAYVVFTDHTGTGSVNMSFGAFTVGATVVQLGQVLVDTPLLSDYPNSVLFSGILTTGVIAFYRKPYAGGYTTYFNLPTAVSGTATAGSTNTITLAAGSSSVNDYYVDRTIRITGGTGAGQERKILFYNGTTKVATTYSNWTTAPDATSTYTITCSASITTVISAEV